ncbi:spondin-2a isoform 2-T2 [Polymixia lowei]
MMSSERFPCGWLQQLLIVLLKLSLSYAGPLQQINGTDCTARGPASYILVFTGHWSPLTFPKQYPLFRPPAQWSKLIAVTHNGQFRLWQEGATASAGAQSFAEVGVTVELVKGAKEARKRRAVGAMYRTAGIPSGIGHSSTELLMQARSSLLSLMVKVIPSPDWFVGVDSLNLCEGGQWKKEVTLDLHPFDAGTDSGFTFSSPNFPTSPPENITRKHRWTARCLSGHPGVCAWGRAPGAASATAPATSSCGPPTPESPVPSWRSTPSARRTTV